MAQTPQTEWRRDAVCVVALALIAPVLLWDVLAGRSGLFARDLFRYSLPMKKLVRDALLGGEFPYWEPALSSGQPLAANPAFQFFYPPQWLLGLFDLLTGFHLLIVLHIALFAVGTFLLLRLFEAGRAAAVIGASASAFGGVGLSISNLLPMLFSVTWVPSICGALLFLTRRWSGRVAVLFALSIALQLTTGEPMIVLQTHLIVLAVFVTLAVRGMVNRGGGPSGSSSPTTGDAGVPLVTPAATYVLAVLLAAVMWLPAIGHLRDSARSVRSHPKEAIRWSLPVARVPELAVRDWLGRPATPERYWGGGLYPDDGAPYLFSLYSGSVVAALALAALVVPFRFRFLLAAVAGGSALLAFGGSTPLFPLMGSVLPVRYPEKFAAVGVLALICLAALALDRCLEELRVAKRVAVFAGGGALVLAAAALFTRSAIAGRAAAAAFDAPAAVGAFAATHLDGSLMFAAAGWAAVAAGALIAARGRRTAAAALFALITIAELAPLWRDLLPRMPHSFFDRPPVVRMLRASAVPSRLFHDGDFGRSAPEAASYRTTLASRGWFARNALMPRTPWLWNYETTLQVDYDETALVPTGRFLRLYRALGDAPAAQRMLLRMSNVRYLLRVAPFLERGAAFQRSPERSVPLEAVELSYSPRYYFSRDVRAVAEAELATVLRSEVLDPTTAFVPRGSFAPANGVVQSVRESRNRVTIDVLADGDAFLVASVTRHRFWTATLDGRPAPLIATNITYQSLHVPRGKHRIELRYRNPDILRGAVISLLALVVLAGLVISVSSSQRRRNERA